jgi:hypothetical protein
MKRIASKEKYLNVKVAGRPADPSEQLYWDTLHDIVGVDPNSEGSNNEVIVRAVTNLIMSNLPDSREGSVRAFAQEFISPYFGEPFIAQRK